MIASFHIKKPNQHQTWNPTKTQKGISAIKKLESTKSNISICAILGTNSAPRLIQSKNADFSPRIYFTSHFQLIIMDPQTTDIIVKMNRMCMQNSPLWRLQHRIPWQPSPRTDHQPAASPWNPRTGAATSSAVTSPARGTSTLRPQGSVRPQQQQPGPWGGSRGADPPLPAPGTPPSCSCRRRRLRLRGLRHRLRLHLRQSCCGCRHQCSHRHRMIWREVDEIGTGKPGVWRKWGRWCCGRLQRVESGWQLQGGRRGGRLPWW